MSPPVKLSEDGHRLLVVSYYFPPMGLSGVQRISKFVKYLPEYGWEVSVLTAAPRGYYAFDESLLNEVEASGAQIIQTGSLDPTRFFGRSRMVKMPAESKRKAASVLSQFLFLPDNKAGWYPAAVRAALRHHQEQPFAAILSSAPPYTAHLVARSVAQRVGVPFVADFRDDWLENPRHEYPTSFHRRIHATLESRVLTDAAHVTTINPVIESNIVSRSVNRSVDVSITVIPQGFDPDEFPVPIGAAPSSGSESKMKFVYAGVFYDAQVPDVFLSGLAAATERNPEFRAKVRCEFAGLVPETFSDLTQRLHVDSLVSYVGYRKHDDIVSLLKEADVLWLTIGKRPGAEGISTGKLYEYFGARKPILGLVPNGVARDDLLKYGAGWLVDPDDVNGVAKALLEVFDLWKQSSLPVPNEEFIRSFDRRALAGRLDTVLRDAVAGHRVPRGRGRGRWKWES